MSWLHKQNIGYSPFPQIASPRTPCPTRDGSEASWSAGTEDISTGKSTVSLSGKSDLVRSNSCSPTKPTVSLVGLKGPSTMCGKKTPESKEPNLKSEVELCNVTPKKIGRKYGNLRRRATLKKLNRRFEFAITELCEQSALTLRNQLEWSELAMCSGVELVLESQGVLGNLPVWTVTLKIPIQSSGAAIKVRKMLSSMNFVETFQSRTCFDGWIDILSQWKSKDLAVLLWPKTFGSLAMSSQNFGTQI